MSKICVYREINALLHTNVKQGMSMYVCVMCYCIEDYIIIITINNFVIQSHHFLGQVLGLRRFKIFSDTIKPMFVKYVLYWLILGYNVSQFY